MSSLSITSRAVGKIGLEVSQTAKAESRALGLPIFTFNAQLQANMVEQSDGQCFEIEYARDGSYTIIRPVDSSVVSPKK
jgi:hypothetical protein